ncbi:MAG: TetR/AcrR family transcriptional regulator [Novosphingobium sp.]
MIERRHRILDAAERLIRKTGGTDFSVRTLASVAEVAPATPFNLFSSKEGLLYALLSRSLDTIISEGLKFKSVNQLFHIVEAATNAVDMFARDPEFMRPLYRVLLGVSDDVHRPRFMERSIGYWKTAVATIPDQKLLSTERQRNFLTAAIQAQFLGLLEFWVHQEFDDDTFRQHSVYGVLSNIMGLLDPENKDEMLPLFQKVIEGRQHFEWRTEANAPALQRRTSGCQ